MLFPLKSRIAILNVGSGRINCQLFEYCSVSTVLPIYVQLAVLCQVKVGEPSVFCVGVCISMWCYVSGMNLLSVEAECFHLVGSI